MQTTSGEAPSGAQRQWTAQPANGSVPGASEAGLAADGNMALARHSPGSSLRLSISASRVRESSGTSTTSKALHSGTTGRNAGLLSARANYESALLSAVRRQIESFEEKVAGQISTLRCQQQRDRLHEAAFSRLEEKMSSVEGLQLRLDQRSAELSGNLKGLSDEMQAQIRRVDVMDDRLWDWRHQLEEEFRQKYTDFEQSIHKVCSGVRVMAASNEDGQKRLSQRVHTLELEVTERLAALHRDDCGQGLKELTARLEALEGQCRSFEEQMSLEAVNSCVSYNEPPLQVDAASEAANAAFLGMIERRVADVADRLNQIYQDSKEAHGKLAVQEEQQRALRTLMEAGEERIHMLLDRVERSDWDGRLELLQQASHEDNKQKLIERERVELLGRRLEFQEQALEELKAAHWQLARDTTASTNTTAFPAALEDCSARLGQAEAHVGLLQAELETLRDQSQLGPCVSQLVVELQEVMPMVLSHERVINRMQSHHADNSLSPGERTVDGLQEAVRELRERLPALCADARAEAAAAAQRELSEVHGKLGEHAALLSMCATRNQANESAGFQTSQGAPLPSKKDLERLVALSAANHELSDAVLNDLSGLKRDLDGFKALQARHEEAALPDRLHGLEAQVHRLAEQLPGSEERARREVVGQSACVAEERADLRGFADLAASLRRELEELTVPVHEELVRCVRLALDGRQLASSVLGEVESLRYELRAVAAAFRRLCGIRAWGCDTSVSCCGAGAAATTCVGGCARCLQQTAPRVIRERHALVALRKAFVGVKCRAKRPLSGVMSADVGSRASWVVVAGVTRA
eukprot:CAMPEP_0171076068 /NCGR_PEP_ID=MMETSP0766_2-20121228/13175_1 /TAXON_ID=439317 /ORGANISM="Gambierdiscus australes, Strain CAWD 149" /LENGTH=813 /DNA_ID=CAMNT_0011532995 /DNA_START=1 /DNA_END=2437 /DNA_ORIENTATION=+